MAYRTIGVKIEGQRDVEAMSKTINRLQKEVAKVISDIKGMGRQKSVASFNVKVNIDTNDAVTQFIKLKRQLEKHTIDLKIKGVSSSLGKEAENVTKATKAMTSGIADVDKSLSRLGSTSNMSRLQKDFDKVNNSAKALNSSIKEIEKIANSNIDKVQGRQLGTISLYGELWRKGKTRNISPLMFPDPNILPLTATGNVSFGRGARAFLSGVTDDIGLVNDKQKDFLKNWIGASNAIERSELKVRDFHEALKTLADTMSKLVDNTTKLVKKVTELTVINPGKHLAKGFVELNRLIIGTNLSLGRNIGNTLINSLSNAFSRIKMMASQVFESIRQETKTLGDAMEVYRLNMQSLGFSETDTNLSMKRLGDYGKASVFNASDLLELASSLYAYERTDAEDIVKAIAGLTAQTRNPTESYKRFQTQMVQMMSSGVLNQQDWRFMRESMNTLGQAEVIKAFESLAKSKGYPTIIDATRKRAISADETLSILKQVGNSAKFQNLVTSIVTPSQAIANLKETLANLFVFDEIDAKGKAVAGPLKVVYGEITNFIKNVSSAVASSQFKTYVRNIGNWVGGAIKSVNDFNRVWVTVFSGGFLKSLEKFSSDFAEGASSVKLTEGIFRLSDAFKSLLDSTGGKLGTFSKDLAENVVDFLTSLVGIGSEMVKGGFLDGVVRVIELYTNISSLAIHSGAIRTFAEQFNLFYEVINNIITQPASARVLGTLVSAVGAFTTELFKNIEALGTKTNLVPYALEVITSLVNFYTDVMKLTKSQIDPQKFETFIYTLKEAFARLLEGLAPIYAELLSSIVNTAGTTTMRNLLNSIVDFILSMNRAVIDLLEKLGGGDVSQGMENALKLITSMVDIAVTITDTLGAYVFAIPLMLNFGKFALTTIKSFADIVTAIQTLGLFGFGNSGGGAVAGGLLGKASGFAGGVTRGIGSILNTPYAVLGSKALGGVKIAWGNLGRLSAQFGDDLYGNYMLNMAKGNGKFLSGVGAFGRASKNLFAPNLVLGTGGFKGFMSSIGSKLLTPKGGLITAVATFATNVINGMIQDSNASKQVKDGANIVTSGVNIGSMALGGASLGSFFGPIGTGVGAVIGGIYGAVSEFSRFSEDKKMKEEAKRFASQEFDKAKRYITQKNKTAMYEIVKGYSDISESMSESFLLTASNTGKSIEQVYNTMQFTRDTAQQFGLTYSKALEKLNVNTNIPNLKEFDLSNTYVKIGDNITSLQEIMNSTGLSAEEALGTLQLASSSVGDSHIQLIDSSHNVLATISNLTEAEKARIEKELSTFNEALAKAGIGGVNTLGNAKNMEEALKVALAGDFATNEDKQKALAEALAQGNQEMYDTYMGLTLSDLEIKAEKALKPLSEIAYSVSEARAKVLDKLRKSPYVTESEYKLLLDDPLEELEKAWELAEGKDKTNQQLKGQEEVVKSWQRLQPLVDALKGKLVNGKSAGKWLDLYKNQLQYVYDNIIPKLEGGGTEENVNALRFHVEHVLEKIGITDRSLQDQVLKKMLDHDATLGEALQLVSQEYGGTDEILTKLSESKSKFVKAVQEAVDKGYITIDEAKRLIESYEASYNSSQTREELRRSAEALAQAVQAKIGGAKRAIAEAIQGLSVSTPGGSIPAHRTAVPAASTGGLISGLGNVLYRSSGGSIWQSRGTDTIPAMLTPGEYVLRKKAVDSIGPGFLQKLNKYGAEALQNQGNYTIINNVYNNNNAKINQNIDNKSQYLNGMNGLDRLMRYV